MPFDGGDIFPFHRYDCFFHRSICSGEQWGRSEKISAPDIRKTEKLTAGAGDMQAVYVADITPTAKTAAEYRVYTDASAEPFALVKDGKTLVYDKAVLAKPAANGRSVIYFTDIRENGYEFFESDIGIYSAYASAGGKVNYRIFADGQQVFALEDFTADRPAQHVSLPLEGVQVLRLVVEANGSNTGDMALWADACFVSRQKKPYLAVDDLEFNRAFQVTESSLPARGRIAGRNNPLPDSIQKNRRLHNFRYRIWAAGPPAVPFSPGTETTPQ